MDETQAKRIYATLNAAVFILNQIERRYTELTSMLHAYHQSKEGTAKADQVTVDIGYPHGNYMVSLAWDIVDWCDRLRKVLGTIAGVKRKEEWYQKLIISLEATAETRNILQHYDREIINFVVSSYPLMGSIFACFPVEAGWHTRCILSTPLKSAYHKNVKISGFPVPLHIEGEIDYITFSIAEDFINLTELMRKLQSSKAGFNDYIQKEYGFVWPEF